MNRQLIVTDNWVEVAADLFLAANPRTVMLAGGSTPAPLYTRLASVQRDWSSTHVFFTDERCVPADHSDSNFAMASRTLLERVPATVHPMDGEHCDADSYANELRSVFGPGIPQFDFAVLGLGGDGHTASLFPGDAALEERESLVASVVRPDHHRLTLTLRVLSAARHAVFLAIGDSKARALKDMLEGGDEPAARVSAARISILADSGGASLLSAKQRREHEPPDPGGTRA